MLDGRSSELHLGSVNPACGFALSHHYWYPEISSLGLENNYCSLNISMEGHVCQQVLHRHNSFWRCNIINYLSPSKSIMPPERCVLRLSLVISFQAFLHAGSGKVAWSVSWAPWCSPNLIFVGREKRWEKRRNYVDAGSNHSFQQSYCLRT